MVALNLDLLILNRAASSKPVLQLGGKFRQTVLIQRQIGDDRHSLATSALRLSAHSNHGGLARFVRLAGASPVQLMAFWAEQFSPIIISHRATCFLYSKSNDCQQYQLATVA
jgi:hypothetical protein